MQTISNFTIFILTIASFLSGCDSFTESNSQHINFPSVYKIDIQQGNVITQQMVDQLRPGMTRNQVQYVMGTPLLENIFDKNQWNYVSSIQLGGTQQTQQTLTIFFKEGKLLSVEGNLHPKNM